MWCDLLQANHNDNPFRMLENYCSVMTESVTNLPKVFGGIASKTAIYTDF